MVGILNRRFVVGELLSERIVGAANAAGGSGGVDVVGRKAQHPHDSRGSDRSEDFIKARVVVGVRRLKILDFEMVGFDLVLILAVVARIEQCCLLSPLALFNYDLLRRRREWVHLSGCRTHRRRSYASIETSCCRPGP